MKKKTGQNRILKKLLACFVIAIALYLFSGNARQLYTTLQLQKQKEVVEKELQLLQEENAKLVSQRNKLEDPNYIETFARGEYMFSKSDEQIFYLPTSNSASSESAEN